MDPSGSAGLVEEPEDLGVDPGAGDQVDDADLIYPETRRSMVAGSFAGIWALLMGVGLISCVVMLVWATAASAGDAAAAWRAVGLTWLGAHHAPMTISGRPVSLMPMGTLLVGLLLNRRSGAWAARLVPQPTRAEVAGIIGGAGLAYGVGAAGIAWLAADGSAAVHPVRAFLAAGSVAAAGSAWGASRELGLAGAVLDRASDATRRTLVAGLAVAVGLFAAGLALVTLSLVWHSRAVLQAMVDLDTGIVGLVGLTLVGILSLPTLAVWAMAVMGGPGFRFGEVGAITAFGGHVDSVPALPVLAAIPASMPLWSPLLLAIPVALGVLAGRIRWGRDLPTMGGALQAAGGVAAVVGATMAGLTLLSSGSLGGGRLASVGPHLVLATAACVTLVVAGFLGQSARQALGLAWDIHRVDPPGAAGADPEGTPGSAAGPGSGGAGAAQEAGGAAKGTGGTVQGTGGTAEESVVAGTAQDDARGAVQDSGGTAAESGSVGTAEPPSSPPAAGTLSDRASALGSAAAARVIGMGSIVAGLLTGQTGRPLTVDLRDGAALAERSRGGGEDLVATDSSGPEGSAGAADDAAAERPDQVDQAAVPAEGTAAAATGTAPTEPATAELAPTEPATAEQATAEPGPAEPAPSEPAPSEPAPMGVATAETAAATAGATATATAEPVTAHPAPTGAATAAAGTTPTAPAEPATAAAATTAPGPAPGAAVAGAAAGSDPRVPRCSAEDDTIELPIITAGGAAEHSR